VDENLLERDCEYRDETLYPSLFGSVVRAAEERPILPT
jgi:hypothetical protein